MAKEEETTSTGPDWAAFAGYDSPNYTMVPDQLFDEHLAFLSGAELKVLLYIIRRRHATSVSEGPRKHGS
jgi:hypothetical protein